ncbi:response regulator transcription factor [uncultured Thiodictyon sp.]|uniref:response regulator n=1 Tax=uncultured Thiodictyon sp. TaxID=1846217 RepID=UPI00260001EA|nr:response regulator transcription factor [uncultured Thiodictyon sp.]
MTEPIRVLIVDGHPLVRAGIIAGLREDPGIAVVGQADTAQESLEQARHLCPDLVVMDIALRAGSDGVKATRGLSAELPQTQVLIFTIHDESHYVVRSLAAGARGCLLKQEGLAELRSGIRAVHQGVLFIGRGVEYPPRSNDPDPLTPRELQVLCLIAQGLANGQIAQALALSRRTVESHRLSIRRKLGLTSAAELTRYAIAHGLCPGLLEAHGLARAGKVHPRPPRPPPH